MPRMTSIEVQVGGFMRLVVGWLFCFFRFGVKTQHITLTAEFSGRTGCEKVGWIHRRRCEGETGGAFDTFMHRLRLFSCSHSPP